MSYTPAWVNRCIKTAKLQCNDKSLIARVKQVLTCLEIDEMQWGPTRIEYTGDCIDVTWNPWYDGIYDGPGPELNLDLENAPSSGCNHDQDQEMNPEPIQDYHPLIMLHIGHTTNNSNITVWDDTQYNPRTVELNINNARNELSQKVDAIKYRFMKA